jgi:protein-L-isoaspartate O-methyltransferase
LIAKPSWAAFARETVSKKIQTVMKVVMIATTSEKLNKGSYLMLNSAKRMFRSAFLTLKEPAAGGTIFKTDERIVLKDPSPQTALDIFKGTWISRLPGEFSKFAAGTTPLFEDERIPRAEKFLGPVAGMNVLDLGPLEGGQAYVLEKMGARSVVSVEANSILYLKCLVAKEILGMNRVQFLCGDIVKYLKSTSATFDMCVASGILYHMADPAELLWLLSQHTDKILLWTHYFDEAAVERNKLTSFKKVSKHEFRGISYNYHRQEYGTGFKTNVYCGGAVTHSSWMTRDGIETALRTFGYTDINVLDDGDSINGPFLLLTASK